jgi:23S rRNA (uridine2552-2'-O)-methyltransferase
MLTLWRGRTQLIKSDLVRSFAASTQRSARSLATESNPSKEDKGIFNKKEAQSIKGKSSSSTQWLQRKFNDKFTRKAHEENLISRAAFKLQEIQRKFRLIKKGNIVLDLGAAPGGWSQIASRLCVYRSEKKKELEKEEEERMSKGQVISVDIKEMEPINGCACLKLDFTEDSAVNTINLMLRGRTTNVVLSDMAPSYSGQKDIDHERLMDLSTRAFEFGKKILKSGGHIVLKVSRGGSEAKLKKKLEECFRKVQYYKPEASFKDSSEIYLVGIGFQKPKNAHTGNVSQFNYTIVPNTSIENFLTANQATEKKVDQTLTEKSTVTSTPKAAANNDTDKQILKEDNKGISNGNQNGQAQPHPTTKKLASSKKQEKYQIGKIFGYKKLI